MTTDTISSFADLDQLDLNKLSPAEQAVYDAVEADDEPAGKLATDFMFSGDHMSFSLRPDIAANQFLVTGILRGIAGNLQFARVSAEDKLDDMQAKAQARMEAGESELDHLERTGLTDAQQIFAESLLEQLTFIEDLFEDIGAFWKATTLSSSSSTALTSRYVRACEQPPSAGPPRQPPSAGPVRSMPSATSLHAAQPSLHAGSN